MPLFSKEQLKYERSIGLVLSDEDNENRSSSDSERLEWTNEQFEEWLGEKSWSENVKNSNREKFNGFISFRNGTYSYE